MDSNHQLLLICNWKMNGSFMLCRQYENLLSRKSSLLDRVELVVFPPAPFFYHFKELSSSLINFAVGAQLCSQYKNGAFTGQLSSEILVEAGCSYVLLNHSEQSMYFSSPETIILCAKRAIEAGITPIICIGELFESTSLFFMNFDGLIENIFASNCENEVIFALEPRENIGSRDSAQINLIQNSVIEFRNYMKVKFPDACIKYKILYGGGVNKANIQKMIGVVGLDGFLIGGASLDIFHLESILTSLESILIPKGCAEISIGDWAATEISELC